MSFPNPYDFREPDEKDIDEHRQAWLDGDLDRYHTCKLCEMWDFERDEQLKEVSDATRRQ